MKGLVNIGLVLGIVLSLTSCFDKSKPNYQYFPNMYEPVGYKTYGEYDVFSGGVEAQLPVEGTIPRGWIPYEYPDTPEGYDSAKVNLTSRVPFTEENLARGKELYGIYCAVCHGSRGDGKGILATREKFLGIPSYDDPARAITQGSIYHVVYYGRNAMGSHASQINETERWQVTQYVLKLKADLEGKAKK